jgi:hypothetical protein
LLGNDGAINLGDRMGRRRLDIPSASAAAHADESIFDNNIDDLALFQRLVADDTRHQRIGRQLTLYECFVRWPRRVKENRRCEDQSDRLEQRKDLRENG